MRSGSHQDPYSPTFGDRVVIVRPRGDLRVGDRGEIVGLSDDREYVGVMIDRFLIVYTVPADLIEVETGSSAQPPAVPPPH